MKKIELLSPAGDTACALAAINGGADAIYIGGKNFSARSFATNFTDTEILEIIDYAHLRHVKVYITINTLYKQDELEEVFKFVNLMHKNGADSFIVQDIGLASFLLKNFNNIILHASTQMTVNDLSGVLFLEELGFKRIVLSRELTLSEINHITKNTNAEIEVFGHGALCYSYSGQCTASSLIGGRSGNRGKCAQPCRQNYKLLDEYDTALDHGYLLSPKDMVSLPVLKDIIQSNVTSLKIEGRMKDENYVHLTTKTYREQIDKIYDNNFNLNPQDIKNLTSIFNRGGTLSTGYFENYSTVNLIGTNIPSKTGTLVGTIEKYDYRNKKATFTAIQKLVPGDRVGIAHRNTGCNINFEVLKNKKVTLNIDTNIDTNRDNKIQVGDEIYKTYDKELFDYIKQTISKDLKKIIINADFTAIEGKQSSLRLYNDNADITVFGANSQTALKNPMSEQTIISKLSKTGSTTFLFDFKNVLIQDNIFLNIKDLNELRRLAIDEFTKKYLESFKKPNTQYICPQKNLSEPKKNKNITVLVRTQESFLHAITEGIYAIYLDYNTFIKDSEFFIVAAKTNDVKLYISLPTILRFDDLDEICNNIKSLDVEGYLVKNYGELYLIKALGKNIIINYNFNTLNNLSLEFFGEIAKRVTLSYELNFNEINKLEGENTEIVVYGKLPVMTASICPVGIYLADKHNDRFCSLRFSDKDYTLKDDKGYEFTVKVNCYNCYSEIFNSSVLYLSDKLSEVLNANPNYIRLEFLDEDENTIKDLIKFHKGILDKCIISEKNITYGHYNRGIL